MSKVLSWTYLGITLSEDPQWSVQIKTIGDSAMSASRTLGFLWRTLKRCIIDLKDLPSSCLIKTWICLFCVWSISDQGPPRNIQRRGAHFIYHDYKQSSRVTNMLTSLSWDSLENRQREARLGLMDTIIGGRVTLGVTLDLDDNLTVASTRTRSVNSHKFHCIGAKTLPYKNSNRNYRELKIWVSQMAD